ncbi:MAG: hypothetical protein ACOX6V_02695 [Patescibacteria group bacterium]|jgi:hypothetical protein
MFFSKIKSHVPLILLLLVWFIVVVANYTPGTFLTGWDNLHPEFNFPLNLSRSLHAVWQEYQGVGLLGGMGHAADLVRQLILWGMSLLFPVSVLRYAWHLGMLLLGSLGIFFLLSSFLKNKFFGKWAGLVGALFYFLNLGTVQNFYVPFEPFSTFFGFLPWGIYSLRRYLERRKLKNLTLFGLVGFLMTPSFYVQTVFIVYAVVVTVFLVDYLLKNISSHKSAVQTHLKIVFDALVTLLAVNAFWLFPVVFFTFTSASVTKQAKINQLSTEETRLRNNAFGRFVDVALLRGFWFDYPDFNEEDQLVYLVQPWRQHLQNPIPLAFGYLFFTFVILGVIYSFRSNLLWRWSLLSILIVSFVMLIGENPPTGFIVRLLQVIPLFSQIFRSLFTKWVVPASFSYSIFVGFGVFWVMEWFYLKGKSLLLAWGLLAAAIGGLVLLALPIFEGQLIYTRVKQHVPQEYFDLFAYLKTQDKQTRIANFPQTSFWGWQWHNWPKSYGGGYRGSGFLWYGIEQPILDRTFDPWSRENEQYYWELKTALNDGSHEALGAIFAKYNIGWVLLDTSVTNRYSSKEGSHEELRQFLEEAPGLVLARQFGFLWLYRVNQPETQNFVSLYTDVPNIAYDFRFSWEDQGFRDYGLYQFSDSGKNSEVTYLFPSLFTNHLQNDKEFDLTEEKDTVAIKNSIKNVPETYEVDIPNILNLEKQVPVKISWQKMPSRMLELTLTYLLPQVTVGNQIYEAKPTQRITLSKETCSNLCYLSTNGGEGVDINRYEEIFTLFPSDTTTVIGLYSEDPSSYVSKIEVDPQLIRQDFEYTKSSNRGGSSSTSVSIILPKVVSALFGTNLIEIDSFKTQPPRNCRNSSGLYERKLLVDQGREVIEYWASNRASACDYFYLDNTPHNQGYLIKLETNNFSGLPFKVGLQNPITDRTELETTLGSSRRYASNWLVLLPSNDLGEGYTVYLDSVSYGREESRNRLRNLTIWSFPYNFIKSLKLVTKNDIPRAKPVTGFSVKHYTPWFYGVALENTLRKETTAVLYQAYNPGWIGVGKVSFFPRTLTHLKINNWANGWKLPTGATKAYFFFWPQLLEYFGFGLLFGWGGVMLFLKRKQVSIL